MDKRFLAILGTILIGFSAFVYWSNLNNAKSIQQTNPSNHLTGKADSTVKFVEYGDFQCPACAGFNAAFEKTVETYKDRVSFQFRNLPISQIHPNAMAAARAGEAAAMQGKFWEMHSALYEQTNWSAWTQAKDPTELFNRYARQIGLNEKTFKADFVSPKVNDIISADRAAFDKTKEDVATPTFFLNGKKIENNKLTDASGNPSVEAFSKLLDAALK